MWVTTLTQVRNLVMMAAVMRTLSTIFLLSLFTLNLISHHVTVDEPPRTGIENVPALHNFFTALADARAGRRLEPVRIMHFGDSHTAADVLTANIRRHFQGDFGDGGAGLIVPRNPMSTRRQGVASGATSGWSIEGIGGRIAPHRIYGPAGIALSTSQPNERAWVEASGNHFELYYVCQPGGGRIDVLVDGGSVLDAPLSLSSPKPEASRLFFDTPAANGRHRVEIRTLTAGQVSILGIVAEHIAPGVVYDVLGVNGARASRILSWNQAALAAVLADRKPDLIVLEYGTNEVADSGWTVVSYQRLLAGILRRLQSAAPQASLILLGPPDRSDLPVAVNRMPLLIEAQRRAAFTAGAAFWSSYDAMGGAGAMNAWVAQGLGQGDHVHLTRSGYDRIADHFYQEMMLAYSSAAPNRRRTSPPDRP
ncbi:MAG TPA: GDSL-type esterase/lipase family protein [Pyrinomonadaceae bacterium]|nr:GDSL-type esterase/lipase family protein [Pyrinomonadaceae bacterium]